VLTFHVKLPIFVARQWIRHRTARLNEISGRYSVMNDDFYIPAPEDVALQSDDNKQGRSAAVDSEEAEKLRAGFEAGQKTAYADYKKLVDRGIARELARINLPLSVYTEWYWQIDLHNLFHFLELRLDPHAQKEIRLYAEVLFDIAKKAAPCCCASFEEHVLRGVRFSRAEFAELRRRIGMAGGGALRGAEEPDHSGPPQRGEADASFSGPGPEKTRSGGGDFPPVPELTGRALKLFEEKLASGRQK
jgi:thymidylate synthase (FAD)